MVEILKEGRKNNTHRVKAADKKEAAANPTNARKPVQCIYCLLNVLFCDDIVDKFAQPCNPTSKKVMDVGLAANDKHFCLDVEVVFKDSSKNNNDLFLYNPYIWGSAVSVDPSVMVPHNRQKNP